MPSIIKSIRRRLILLKSKGTSPFSFKLGELVFDQPRLLLKNGGKNCNKAGNLCWFASMGGEPVKIYECHSNIQAMFIEQISNRSELCAYLPACLLRSGKHLVVQWITGKQVSWKQVARDREFLNQIARIQAAIHGYILDIENVDGGFDYIKFLTQRAQHYKGIFPLDEAIQKILTDLNHHQPYGEKRISHSDLTARNLILEKSTGNVKIIDNEALTLNRYYLIDLFNTEHSLEGFRNELLNPYLARYIEAGGNLDPLVTHEPFFSALWYLRQIGTLLQSNRAASAFRAAQRYLDGCAQDHPVIQFAKRGGKL